MIKVICDLCHREVKQPAQAVNFCERCVPFADEYLKEAQVLAKELAAENHRKMESLRNRFLREVVLKDRNRHENERVA